MYVDNDKASRANKTMFGGLVTAVNTAQINKQQSKNRKKNHLPFFQGKSNC